MNNIKICCFSDTHTLEKGLNIPECDILIFAGDCMGSGYRVNELMDFLLWFKQQPGEIKIMIAGNHDRYIENYPSTFEKIMEGFPEITYLDKKMINVAGINIYGIPDTHIFYNWAFNRTQKELDKIAENIPGDVNILITHGPAWGILDSLENGELVGEPQWTEKIKDLPDLKYHISGHIHCAYGIAQVNGLSENTYKAINCAVLNEEYELQNDPIIFEYEKEY